MSMPAELANEIATIMVEDPRNFTPIRITSVAGRITQAMINTLDFRFCNDNTLYLIHLGTKASVEEIYQKLADGTIRFEQMLVGINSIYTQLVSAHALHQKSQKNIYW